MYFKRFPDIYYECDIGGVEQLKVVKDITLNVRLRKAVLENIVLYDEYDIKDGETPEIIAYNVYGSAEYHWVIMLANERYDYIEDWPMDSRTLDTYIKNKYTNPYDTHHYKDPNGFVVNSTAFQASPVTNYQYEEQLNEQKRRIKLIQPGLIGQILRQYKELM